MVDSIHLWSWTSSHHCFGAVLSISSSVCCHLQIAFVKRGFSNLLGQEAAGGKFGCLLVITANAETSSQCETPEPQNCSVTTFQTTIFAVVGKCNQMYKQVDMFSMFSRGVKDMLVYTAFISIGIWTISYAQCYHVAKIQCCRSEYLYTIMVSPETSLVGKGKRLPEGQLCQKLFGDPWQKPVVIIGSSERYAPAEEIISC